MTGINEDEYAKFEIAESLPLFHTLWEIKRFTSCDLDYLVTGKRFGENSDQFDQFTPLVELDNFRYPQPTLGWYWESDTQHRMVDSCRPIQERSCPSGVVGSTIWEYVGANPDQDERWRCHIEIRDRRKPFRDFIFKGRKELLNCPASPSTTRKADSKGTVVVHPKRPRKR